MSHPYPPSSQGGYGNYPVGQGGRGLAIAALILGIVAILTTWFPVLGLPFLLASLGAVIVGVIALVKARGGRAVGRGMALTGIVLGVLSILTSLAVHVFLLRAADAISTGVSSSISGAQAEESRSSSAATYQVVPVTRG